MPEDRDLDRTDAADDAELDAEDEVGAGDEEEDDEFEDLDEEEDTDKEVSGMGPTDEVGSEGGSPGDSQEQRRFDIGGKRGT